MVSLNKSRPRSLSVDLHDLEVIDAERWNGLHGPDFSTSKSLNDGNSLDNRYSNIASWDHALLPGNYLNASLISPYPNAPSKQSFIASQAPLPHTFPRFFQALQQQNIALLVNLTPLQEGSRKKADQYWPDDSAAVQVGDGWQVTLKREEDVAKPLPTGTDEAQSLWRLKRRQLQLQHSPTGTQHDLVQLHFTSWPDHSTSTAAFYEHLLRLIETEANAASLASPRPIWLHCSAGVGRTGTAIAGLMALDLQRAGIISSATRQQEKAERLTVQIIQHMRKSRPSMVQGKQQAEMIAALIQKLSAETSR